MTQAENAKTIKQGAQADAPITDTPLPQGAATDLAAAQSATNDQQQPAIDPGQLQHPSMAAQQPVQEQPFKPSGDLEEFLHGASTNPQQSVLAGISNGVASPLPQDVLPGLAVLGDLARMPDASDRVRALYSVMVNRAAAGRY